MFGARACSTGTCVHGPLHPTALPPPSSPTDTPPRSRGGAKGTEGTSAQQRHSKCSEHVFQRFFFNGHTCFVCFLPGRLHCFGKGEGGGNVSSFPESLNYFPAGGAGGAVVGGQSPLSMQHTGKESVLVPGLLLTATAGQRWSQGTVWSVWEPPLSACLPQKTFKAGRSGSGFPCLSGRGWIINQFIGKRGQKCTC